MTAAIIPGALYGNAMVREFERKDDRPPPIEGECEDITEKALAAEALLLTHEDGDT